MKAACKKELKKAAEHLCDAYDSLTAAMRAENNTTITATISTISEARTDAESSLRMVRSLTERRR